MNDPGLLEARETLQMSVASGLVNGLRLHNGTALVGAMHFGGGVVLRAASAGCAAEVARMGRRVEPGRKSTICVHLGQHGRAELRHLGSATTLGEHEMAIVDSDAGFSTESTGRHEHTTLQLPTAILGPRLRLLRARAGERFASDDPKTTVVRQGLLSLANAGQVLSADERSSAFGAALHLLDILITPRAVGTDERLFLRATTTMDRRLSDGGLTPASLARELGVARRSVEMAFARHGLTISRSIWERRLERAAELIAADRSGRKTLQRIASDCGFVSAAHFSRTFSARFGKTPSEYRTHAVLSDGIRDRAPRPACAGRTLLPGMDDAK